MKPLTTARAIRNGLAMLTIVIGAGIGACFLPQPNHRIIQPPETSTTVKASFGHNPGDCPTEDSCAIDYYGGAWHIRPVTP